MLYKKNKEFSLSPELFKNPTCEYRGTPFWAWNGALTKEELCRQIDIFDEMGLGGFHIHVRTGLETEYLSDEYMSLIRACVDKAKDSKMLAWLYDEDRWPSGAAGGIVTKEEKYRARYLSFTPEKHEKGTLLAIYDVILDSDGFLEKYRRISENDNVCGDKWYAYLLIDEPSNWYNGQTYVDTLSEEAIKRFIEVTHEKYREAVGDEFDKTVPAIFTDEPQFSRKETFRNSFDKNEVCLPWTDKLPEEYRRLYGTDILDTVPELFWELPGCEVSVHRYRYHDIVSELFAHAFADTVGGWCDENGIALTGHMMDEPSLRSQTSALGEAMRSYRGFALPGIDMLCNSHEFTTAKQAQSASHQYGREGVMSELYGVTGWDCDFRTYKHQGDWQACLGVTVRVPHLSWYTMKGEAKRDYPASIHFQSPWYKEYAVIENHFARVNTALTRGKPVVRVGVIHPVESYWLHWGPSDKTGLLRRSLDKSFDDVTHWLLEGSIDFDFISESLLPSLCEKGGNPLKVGEMAYDAVVVPCCETLRRTTLERLSAFRENGGKLIFIGDAPGYIDAEKSDDCKKLFSESTRITLSASALLGALDAYRTVTIRYDDGDLSDNFLYQLRRDNDCSWLFLGLCKEPKNKDVDGYDDLQIIIEGEYTAEVYDTETGEIYVCPVSYRNGKTVVIRRLYGYDSLLLRLTDGKGEEKPAVLKNLPAFTEPYFDKVEYELNEENVLLLDMAEFKLDTEKEFSPVEEVLRLDNICRERIGIPHRRRDVPQPYTVKEDKVTNSLTLRFTVKSKIDYEGALLAIEEPEKAVIFFNGIPVSNIPVGNYVDNSIFKVRLPKISKGKNILEITIPFGKRTNTERVFILGNFGVACKGRTAEIIEKPEKISFGSILNQGFPFYGGAVTYKFKASTSTGRLSVCTPFYRGGVISVGIDGKKAGTIIYPPYVLTAENLEKGEHEISLTLYTHRENTFGAHHLVRKNEFYGPGAWRTTGANWSYEYLFREAGILMSPKIAE